MADAPWRAPRHRRRRLRRAARRRCLPRCLIRCRPPTPPRWPSSSSRQRRSSGGEEREKQSVSEMGRERETSRSREHRLKYTTLSSIISANAVDLLTNTFI